MLSQALLLVREVAAQRLRDHQFTAAFMRLVQKPRLCYFSLASVIVLSWQPSMARRSVQENSIVIPPPIEATTLISWLQ